MRRRKRVRRWLIVCSAVATCICLVQLLNFATALLLITNCLSGSPSCSCSWRGGKFVADCSNQSLEQVPKNDYYEYLLSNAGNNQMQTLNRDIQQLNLASNNITSLRRDEFNGKKFRNLQKINLMANNLLQIDVRAFHKLTGLIELDLSENLISSFGDDDFSDSSSEKNRVTSRLLPEQSGSFKRAQDRRGLQSNANRVACRDRSSVNSSTFLQDITQLRVLNLASNQLSELKEFTFSPLAQLRQLILSRNKISFIDKRAFDGLNVLNILHLDGNRLAYLDGRVLVKLPRIHAIRLGGRPSRWRCDCRLRKLMGQLSDGARQSQAANGKWKPGRILEDEPSCLALQWQEPSNSANASQPTSGPANERLWTDMNLSELQCEPKLEATFMGSQIMNKMDNNSDNSNAEYNKLSLPPLKLMNIDDTGKQRRRLNQQPKLVTLAEQHYLASEPIELTCAFQVSDGLDLDLVQVDWWHLEASGRWNLLWRSADQADSADRQQQQQNADQVAINEPKHPPNRQSALPNPSEYTVIDYVTRANGTVAGWRRQEEAPEDNGHQTETGRLKREDLKPVAMLETPRTRDKDEDGHCNGFELDQTGEIIKLVRVVHLIAMANSTESSVMAGKPNEQPLDRLFLCRITNRAGQVDVVYPLQVSLDGRLAHRDSRRRQELRHLLEDDSKPSAHWLHGSPALTLPIEPMEPLRVASKPSVRWSMDRVKSAIEQELLATTGSIYRRPLFIPVHMPREVLDSFLESSPLDSEKQFPIHSADSQVLGGPSSARSLSSIDNQDHQRPATRGTNASSPSNYTLSARFETRLPFPGKQRTNDDLDHNQPEKPSGLIEDAFKSVNKATKRLFGVAAVNLIKRYTSNMDTLIDPVNADGLAQNELDGLSSEQVIIAHIKTSRRDAKLIDVDSLSVMAHNLINRLLDKRAQPLFFGALIGILASITVALLIKVRLRCLGSSRRQVGDVNDADKTTDTISQEGTPCKTIEEEEEEEEEEDNVVRKDLLFIDKTKQNFAEVKDVLALDRLTTSGESSSSTTYGSQRKLILSPQPYSIAATTFSHALPATTCMSERFNPIMNQQDNMIIEFSATSVDSSMMAGDELYELNLDGHQTVFLPHYTNLNSFNAPRLNR